MKSNNAILIVEDDNDIREVYSLVLKHSGYDIYTASNGQEALSSIDSCDPKLVLLDIFMPVMDGETFLRTVDLTKYPDTKVVVCSNTTDENLMQNMLKLGAQKVVLKSTMAPSDLTSMVAPYMQA